ncbi:type II toxin-antitoxin system prevent-host-death family antitoxin [Streptomyces sp. NPDC091412]|uniref:type II toxin-antitoxin system prevent-host-death family antitoxin n=1 Tax=Streptomyces sp. NPDC091412 TaxID=3366002 RepID=UPI0037F98389
MYISVRERSCQYADVMTERSEEMSVADARRQFADVLNAASARGQITYITSRGRRVAAVVPLPIAEAADQTDAGEAG